MKYVSAIALVLLVALLCAWHRTQLVEADVARAVAVALARNGLDQVSVAAHGRQVTLRGEVVNLERKELAERTAAAVPATAGITSRLSVAALTVGSGFESEGVEPATTSDPSADVSPEGPESAVSTDNADSTDSLNGADSPGGLEEAREDCQRTLDALLSGQRIDFASSSAEIAATSDELLDGLVEILSRCGELRIEVAGHTDASGPRKENLELSVRRAEAVVDRLVASGLLRERLTAVGYGPDVPLVDNATPEGRAVNRRIEFRVEARE